LAVETDDREALVRRKILADRGEVIAEPTDGLRAGTPCDAGQVIGYDDGAGAQAQVEDPLVDPDAQLACHIGARATQLEVDVVAGRRRLSGGKQHRHCQRAEQCG